MGFQQALSGLNAASKNLDVTGNNVANANTVGFKSSRTQFADVYASSLTGSSGLQAGLGTKLVGIPQEFAQGSITSTSNPLDLAINGQGFFRLSDNGNVSYTRAGQFHIDKDGYIVNPENRRLTGYNVGPGGAVDSGAPSDVRLSNPDVPPHMSTAVETLVNLDSRNTVLPAAGFDVNDPSTYHDSTSLAIYDSLGNAHTMTSYFVKTAANVWDVFGSVDGTQIGAAKLGTLTFRTDGAIDTTATTLPFAVNVPVATGAVTPVPVTLDLGGSTQFGSKFGVNALSQDGYTAGKLTGFSIGVDGMILGRYSNGNTNVQGQVVLAKFPSSTGLQPAGGTAWAETPESGQPLIGAPGSGSFGAMQAGAVEDSNVDLTAELVNMITAQRFYQANAQTIKTQDSLLQTMVNLR